MPFVPGEEVEPVLKVLQDHEDQGPAVDEVAGGGREQVDEKVDPLFDQIFPEKRTLVLKFCFKLYAIVFRRAE